MFTEKVEIKEIPCPSKRSIKSEYVFKSITEKYGEDVKFYEVLRPFKGLARSVLVLYARDRYYSLRIYESAINEGDFDLGKYNCQRVLLLKEALIDHVPNVYYIKNDEHKFVIILQDFIFAPICDFTDSKSLFNLLKVIVLASKNGIVLDYNHNHWLFDKEKEILNYVDNDFMGQPNTDIEETMFQNMNQSLIFVNEKNCREYTKAYNELMNFEKLDTELKELLIKVIKRYVAFFRVARSVTSNVETKISCLNNCLEDRSQR